MQLSSHARLVIIIFEIHSLSIRNTLQVSGDAKPKPAPEVPDIGLDAATAALFFQIGADVFSGGDGTDRVTDYSPAVTPNGAGEGDIMDLTIP